MAKKSFSNRGSFMNLLITSESFDSCNYASYEKKRKNFSYNYDKEDYGYGKNRQKRH